MTATAEAATETAAAAEATARAARLEVTLDTACILVPHGRSHLAAILCNGSPPG